MRVVWTDRAKARLRQIHTYIAQDELPNAERMVDRLTQRAEQLASHPRSGRVVERYRRDDLRELIEAPYRIIYVILAARIDIVTVRDSRPRTAAAIERPVAHRRAACTLIRRHAACDAPPPLRGIQPLHCSVRAGVAPAATGHPLPSSFGWRRSLQPRSPRASRMPAPAAIAQIDPSQRTPAARSPRNP